jgi:hypothetical protein
MSIHLSPRRAGLVIFVVFLFHGCAALAGQSVQSLIDNGINAICANFAAVVSKAEGGFTDSNPFGCLGAFQFCPATLRQYFSGSKDEFLNNPKTQTAAWTQYEKDQWAVAKKNGLTSIIGKVVDLSPFAGPTKITASAILMACQFGCGKVGKLAKYVSGMDCGAADVKDGNNLSVCAYLSRGVGKDVSCFTGEPADVVAVQNGPVIKVENKPAPNNETKPAEVSSPPQAAACTDFGNEGPLEILIGRYTLRFGSAAKPDTVKTYLDVLNKENK